MAQPPGNGPYKDVAGVEMDMRIMGANQLEFESRILTLEARVDALYQRAIVAMLMFQTALGAVTRSLQDGMALQSVGVNAVVLLDVPQPNDQYKVIASVTFPAVYPGPAGATFGAGLITTTGFSLGLSSIAAPHVQSSVIGNTAIYHAVVVGPRT